MVSKDVYSNECMSWMYDNGLVGVDDIGKKYTWSNFQGGHKKIVSKLNRDIVNDGWL